MHEQLLQKGKAGEICRACWIYFIWVVNKLLKHNNQKNNNFKESCTGGMEDILFLPTDS